jgi:hypothetical protein
MSNQRMFHGSIRAAALADQLAARFSDRQHRTVVTHGHGTVLIQIGSKHGTPLTINIADTQGSVLVNMSRDRDWLDRVADASELIARAGDGDLLSLLAMIPDAIGELSKDNLAPRVWDAINEIFSLSRALAGEKDGPRNPKVCSHCLTANPPENERCMACGAVLPVDLPRVCPKCGRGHTSDALFCQACGTRLIEEE